MASEVLQVVLQVTARSMQEARVKPRQPAPEKQQSSSKAAAKQQ
jgi:hypothetical protein